MLTNPWHLWKTSWEARKRTNKNRFWRAKAFIVRNNNAADRLKASLSAIEKQKIKKCARSQSLQWFFTSWPSSCGIKCPGWGANCSDTVKPLRQLYGSPTVSGLGSLLYIWLRGELSGYRETCGTALRLFNCINETLSGLGSLLFICCSNSEREGTNFCQTNETHHSAGTTRGRPIFDVNTTFAAEFTVCFV